MSGRELRASLFLKNSIPKNMYKHINMVAFFLCMSAGFTASACDLCGCATSGGIPGVLPGYRNHFAGIAYQYQSFESTHPTYAGETGSLQSQDGFHSFTAWGRWYPTKKLQVLLSLPYHYNYVKEAGHTTIMQGLGDMRILADYRLIDTEDSNNNGWRHMVFAGGGIKLPTGKRGMTSKEGIVLSNMQPGTGSWDFLLHGNYTLRYNKAGINIDLLYQLNTVNKFDYRYGNRWNGSLNLFLLQETGKLTWQPQLGVRYLHSDTDKSSYRYSIKNPYSGGYQAYLMAGTGIYFKDLAFSISYGIPAIEHYAGGLVKSHNRLEVQFFYLF